MANIINKIKIQNVSGYSPNTSNPIVYVSGSDTYLYINKRNQLEKDGWAVIVIEKDLSKLTTLGSFTPKQFYSTNSSSNPTASYVLKGKLSNFNKSARSGIKAFAAWAREKLPSDIYNYFIKNNSNYTFVFFQGGSKVAYWTKDLAHLRRASIYLDYTTMTESEAKSGFNQIRNINWNYTNGFYLNAGYYFKNKLRDETNSVGHHVIFNDNGELLRDTTLSAEEVRNILPTSGNYHVAELNSHTGENNVARYDDVTSEFSISGSEGWGSGYGSGGITDFLTNETVHITDATEIGSSTAQLNYIGAFNNYKLVFVPCKDSREGTNDVFTNNTNLKLQSYDSQIIEEKVPHYETTDSTIYALVNSVPSGATKNSSAESLTQIATSSVDIISFANDLDNFFHYNRAENGNCWSVVGDVLPGLIKNKFEEKPNLQQYYHYYYNRMPRACCLIVLDDREIEVDSNNIVSHDEFKKLVVESILLSTYFSLDLQEKMKYKFVYFQLELRQSENGIYGPNLEDYIEITKINLTSFSTFISMIQPQYQVSLEKDYNVSCSVKQERGTLNLYDFRIFEAYTRGHDFIQEDYTTVRPAEQSMNELGLPQRIMDFDDNYFTYKYTGRDFDIFANQDKPFEITGAYCALVHEKDLLTESDVTLGEAYGCQDYFIQAIKYPELDDNNQKTKNYLYKDTFKITDFVQAIDSTKYIEEDLEIKTGKIDLLRCQYYNPNAAKASNGWCDCCFGSYGEYKKECLYQKLGICPYRFISEKHPRRIRTLEQSKSNRFNLIQELSKVFEFYPYFYIEYDDNGKVKLDKDGKMRKHIFYTTEKGSVNYNGFRYEKNLSSVSRNVDSSSFTTKMYVQSVDSELTDSGTCGIETATDNIGRNSYLLDFSYYTKKGLLNAEQTQRDIYGIEKGDMAFLPTIGAYNKKYDELSNLITTLTGEEMTTLQSEIIVASTGITTALEERKKVSQTMYQFKVKANDQYQKFLERQETLGDAVKITYTDSYTTSDSYKAYLEKYREQATILWGLIEQLFFSKNYFTLFDGEKNQSLVNLDDLEHSVSDEQLRNKIATYKDKYCKGELFWRLTLEGFDNDDYVPPFTNWNDFKDEIVDKYLYETNGQLGQYKGLYDQVKYWKTEREKILNKINDVYSKFYKIYEPYIKEGTWTDSNYLTDNEYYWAAVSVLSDSCKPKVDYTFSVIDLSPIEIYGEDYEFDLGDITYVQDIDFFGANPKTGLPNKEKVMISEMSYDLDQPKQNSIKVQNYSTQFDDLFESISASVQSLTFNENTYRRASNFTSQQYIQTDSLQGGLDQGNLTLIDANRNNVKLDDSGAQGTGISNAASQYKLTGEGLYFSTDGGTTWDVGVGPQGMNADYIKFGQLDASKIQIVDGQYIYFLWDKNGINAYRNPATSTNGLVDFARFNKYGLSLIENNHVRLRAGYEYKSIESGTNPTGDYSQELPLKDQNVGFYLYNDTGKPIFKTETASEYNSKSSDYSARLSLKGEIFATNKNLDSDDRYSTGQAINTVFGKRLRSGYRISDLTIVTYYPDNFGKTFLTGNGFKATKSTNESGEEIWKAGEWFFTVDQQTTDENGNITVTSTGGKEVTLNKISGTEESDTITYSVIISREVSEANETKPSKYWKLQSENTLHKEDEDISYTAGRFDKTSLTFKWKGAGTAPESIKIKTDGITINEDNTISFDLSKGVDNGNQSNLEVTIGERYFVQQAYTQKDNNYYRMNIETVKGCYAFDPSASQIIVPQELSPKDFSFYNISDEAATTFSLEFKALYEQIDNSSEYSQWAIYEDSNELIETQSSIIATGEVGVFINNKVSLEDDGSSTVNDLIDTTTDVIEEETNSTEDTDNPNPFTKSGEFYLIGDTFAQILQNNSSYSSYYLGYKNLYFDNIESTLTDEDKGKIKDAKQIAIAVGLDKIPENTSDLSSLIEQTKTVLKKIAPNIEKFYICSTIGTNDQNYYENDEFKLSSYNSALQNAAPNDFVDLVTNTIPYSGNSVFEFDIAKTADAIYNAFAKVVGGETITPGESEAQERDSLQTSVLEGGERVFTIAIAGKDSDNSDVYRNILSVLKNGSLYIGGIIENEFGQQLNLPNIGYLPDKIRVREPGIIMTNDGNMYCDWDKFFYLQNGAITDLSLMKALNSIQTNLGNIAGGMSTGMASGYYLIDPIA